MHEVQFKAGEPVYVETLGESSEDWDASVLRGLDNQRAVFVREGPSLAIVAFKDNVSWSDGKGCELGVSGQRMKIASVIRENATDLFIVVPNSHCDAR